MVYNHFEVSLKGRIDKVAVSFPQVTRSSNPFPNPTTSVPRSLKTKKRRGYKVIRSTRKNPGDDEKEPDSPGAEPASHSAGSFGRHLFMMMAALMADPVGSVGERIKR